MLILSTGSLYKYGLNRIFEIARELGFDGVEIFMNDVYDTHDKKYIEKLIQTFEIPVVALHISSKTNSPKMIREAVSMAESLNIPTVITRVPYFTDFRFVSWFKNYLPKLQDKTEVNIAIENAPAGKGFLLPQYAMKDIYALKKFQHVCLDTSHLVSHHIDLMRAYKTMKKKISFIHLSNWHKSNEHWMLNEGMLPLESFLTKIARDGYQGPISIKYDLKHIGGGKINKAIKHLKKAKDFYEQYYLANFISGGAEQNLEE
jgi:sugar phosphate isomerase/epimerase